MRKQSECFENSAIRGITQRYSRLLRTILAKDLDTALHCLGQQLAPLRAHAESSKFRHDQLEIMPMEQMMEPAVPVVDPEDCNISSKSMGIKHLLRISQVEGYKPGQGFLPLSTLRDILTEDRIMSELLNHCDNLAGTRTESNTRRYAHVIRCRYLKIFAILVMMESEHKIYEFLKAEVMDRHLPLIECGLGSGVELARSASPDHPLEHLRAWKGHERDSFLLYQRGIDVPYLSLNEDGTVQHVDFAAQTVLPILQYETFQGGDLSAVRKVKLHPGCHGFHGLIKKVKTAKQANLTKRLIILLRSKQNLTSPLNGWLELTDDRRLPRCSSKKSIC
jgi:hypothetical protein